MSMIYYRFYLNQRRQGSRDNRIETRGSRVNRKVSKLNILTIRRNIKICYFCLSLLYTLGKNMFWYCYIA